MKYFKVIRNGRELYYKFDEVINQGWVRDDESDHWVPSALFSNIKHFERWIKLGYNSSVEEIKESEMFIDLI